MLSLSLPAVTLTSSKICLLNLIPAVVVIPDRFAPMPVISATVMLGVPVNPAAVPELLTAMVPEPLSVLPLEV